MKLCYIENIYIFYLSHLKYSLNDLKNIYINFYAYSNIILRFYSFYYTGKKIIINFYY